MIGELEIVIELGEFRADFLEIRIGRTGMNYRRYTKSHVEIEILHADIADCTFKTILDMTHKISADILSKNAFKIKLAVVFDRDTRVRDSSMISNDYIEIS